MVDILQAIVQFLNINCSVVTCYYPNPLEGLFYLFFFPTVFIILFIYILANLMLKGGGLPQGLRLLIGVAVYIFIILQGWFTLVVSLSRIWFILLIVLGGLWYFIRAHFGGEERVGRLPSIGLLKYAKERAKEAGGRSGLEKRIEDRISTMRAIFHEIEHLKPGTDVSSLIARYWTIKNETEALIKELETVVGWPASKAITSKYWKKISEMTEKFEKMERKVA